MQNTVVVYQSKYGATKRYAEWLSEMLDCFMVEKAKCTISMLQQYDTIVYGGGIYATGIAGLSLIKKNYEHLKNKKVIVFAVGASPYEQGAFEEIRNKNMTGGMLDVPFFYCRGAFYESKMTVGDRFLVGLLKKTVGKKDPSEYETWEKALMEAVGEANDWTSRENLAEIAEYIRNQDQQA